MKSVSIVVSVLTVACIGIGCNGASVPGSQMVNDQSAARHVDKEQSVRIASAFLNNKNLQRLNYRKQIRRKDFPPFTTCHVLDSPLSVTSRSGRALKSEMWVEAGTGKLLAYLPDASYTGNKNRGKPAIVERDIMTRERAQKIAEDYISHTGVSMEGMRLTASWLRTPLGDNNYYGYDFVWARFTSIKGIGEVEMPETILFTVDAVSGEADEYLYKNYPVAIKLTPPTVTKWRAEELARECCNPRNVESTTINLMAFPGNYPTYDRPALAWCVVFREKGADPGNPLPAAIDAHTGEILLCGRHDGR